MFNINTNDEILGGLKVADATQFNDEIGIYSFAVNQGNTRYTFKGFFKNYEQFLKYLTKISGSSKMIYYPFPIHLNHSNDVKDYRAK